MRVFIPCSTAVLLQPRWRLKAICVNSRISALIIGSMQRSHTVSNLFCPWFFFLVCRLATATVTISARQLKGKAEGANDAIAKLARLENSRYAALLFCISVQLGFF